MNFPDPPASISYRKLRQAIGWLGLLLPLLVVLVTKVFGDCDCLQDSISHYYYTIAGPVFVGVLWGLALVLIFYPTYDHDPRMDGILTTVSGVCAILIAMVPTNALSHDSCGLFVFEDAKLLLHELQNFHPHPPGQRFIRSGAFMETPPQPHL
jgi:hypothetical protein